MLLAVQKAYLNLRSAEQTIQSTQTAVAQGQESFRIATLVIVQVLVQTLMYWMLKLKLTDARNNLCNKHFIITIISICCS